MSDLSRRKLLTSAAPVAVVTAAGFSLASCTMTASNVLPTVIDAVIGVMTPVCQVIPGIVTLVDIIAKAFPEAVGVSAITDTLAKQIAEYVCSLFTASGVVPGKPASHKLKASVNGSSIDLHGWTIVNGKIVHF